MLLQNPRCIYVTRITPFANRLQNSADWQLFILNIIRHAFSSLKFPYSKNRSLYIFYWSGLFPSITVETRLPHNVFVVIFCRTRIHRVKNKSIHTYVFFKYCLYIYSSLMMYLRYNTYKYVFPVIKGYIFKS